MKKSVFIALFALILQPCFSQGKGNSFLNDLGVFVGPGFSTIMGGESWKGSFGFIVGVDSKLIPLSDNSSVTAGLGVSMQGAAYEESGADMGPGYGDYQLSGNVSLTYLFIPILYHHVFNGGVYAEAGLQPGFLLAAKDKYDSESYDYKDYVKKFDLGIPVGVGYQLNKKLSIGARATFGITNLDDSGSDTADHNFMLVAVLRYAFKLSDDK